MLRNRSKPISMYPIRENAMHSQKKSNFKSIHIDSSYKQAFVPMVYSLDRQWNICICIYTYIHIYTRCAPSIFQPVEVSDRAPPTNPIWLDERVANQGNQPVDSNSGSRIRTSYVLPTVLRVRNCVYMYTTHTTITRVHIIPIAFWDRASPRSRRWARCCVLRLMGQGYRIHSLWAVSRFGYHLARL